MRSSIRVFRTTAVALACLGWLLPRQALCDWEAETSPESTRAPIVDVHTAADGTLGGKLVDQTGEAIGDQVVALHCGAKAIAHTKTNKQGDFVFERVSGGVYQIIIDDAGVGCRVWPKDMAPPAATERLLVVVGAPVVRGQQPIGAAFSSPLFVGAVLAAAIAIPVAVHNSKDDPSGS
jgi:hypothetical protein